MNTTIELARRGRWLLEKKQVEWMIHVHSRAGGSTMSERLLSATEWRARVHGWFSSKGTSTVGSSAVGDSTETYAREQTSIVQKIASEHNGSDFVFAEDSEAKKELWKLHLLNQGARIVELQMFSMLWKSASYILERFEDEGLGFFAYLLLKFEIRKQALWAFLAMQPGFEAMISDVCVPLSHLAELISRSKKELDASPLVCAVVAHAGDGNFHTGILFDPSQEEHLREAERLNHFMVHAALSMEGTCTGEHGVGTGKMKFLEKELGIEALTTMKGIKEALDPNNIMNPGKIIPPHVCF